MTHREVNIGDDLVDRLADVALGYEELADAALEVIEDERDDPRIDEIEQHRHRLQRQESIRARGVRTMTSRRWDHASAVRDVLNVRRRKTFLTELARTGVVGTAAAAAGMSPSTFASLRKADKDFAERWDRALDFAADVVEHEVFIRAVIGRERKIFQNGLQVDTVVERSDRLLEMLAKARKPQKFRDNVRIESDFKGGVLVVPGVASEVDWERDAMASQAKFRENQGDEE